MAASKVEEVKWTKEQEEAIYTHGCNLLVAAAAGSGKTAVLVERIIKIITDYKEPMDIDRLLVVTFTNAAASEMKERIAKAISDEIAKHPKSRQLQRQLTLLNKASITTIHSFCLDIIRNNFHYINIDPSFRVADETETILLKGETMEEMFEQLYEMENCSEEFLRLVEYYSNNKDDMALQNIVLDLYSFAMSSPSPKETLINMAEDFNVGEDFLFGNSKWAKVILKDAKIELIGLKSLMENALEIINNTEGLEPYLEDFQNELAMINDLILSTENSWDSLKKSLEDVNFGKLKPCKKCENKGNQEKVKTIRDKIKKHLREGMKEKISSHGGKETTYDLIELYPIMKALSQITMEFMDRYGLAKRERGIIDFNDFEHFTLSILSNEEVASALREKYIEILVDEYQDSNYVQEAIINAIAKKDEDTGKNINVFMVGDVKQSIYRFRQAKPELFLSKYSSYSLEEGTKERKIRLFKNFRSRKEILEAVNFIFTQIMSLNLGELEYNEEEALNLGAAFAECKDKEAIVGGPIELNIIEKVNEERELSKEGMEEQEGEEDLLSDIQLEARFAAKRIHQLVNPEKGEVFKIYDKDLKIYRRVDYRDIVILLRSTSSWAPVFMDELKKYAVPAYADVGSGYFEALEIKIVLALLQIIDNPRQDIPLIAILRSPIGAFTPEELIDIRTENKNGDFYEGLLKLSQKEKVDSNQEESKLIDKCINFLYKLKLWREKSIHMPIDEFIWYLYMDTGYYGYVGALAGGVQRQANLRILFQRAKQYENTSYKGLFNFISFINKLRVSSGDMGSAKILGENENVVRIMSIHKSKGLEFPVVFLSALGKNFNMQDLNKRILFHSQLGYGTDFISLEKRISYPTVLKEALKRKIKIESLSEEMRILYVALTRAKEKLIITGRVKSLEKEAKKWSHGLYEKNKKLSEYEVSKAKNFLDWICPSVMRHKEGKVLREIAGIEENEKISILEDASKWHIIVHSLSNVSENLLEEKVQEVIEGKVQEAPEEVSYYEEIDRRLTWQYPFIEASKLPTLLTVTEVKRMESRFQKEEMYETYAHRIYTPSLVKRPAFMEKKKALTGAEKGTAMHAVMQKINIYEELSEKALENQINRMVEKNLITEEQGKSVDIPKILKFFNSTLGKRILKAKKIQREVPFHIQLRSTEVYKDLPKDKYKDESIILQGIIDCYFEEEDGIVLIDYKTDYYKEGNEEAIKDKYRTQLEYYARAINSSNNKKVKEKYLYLFYNDKEVEIK